MSVKIKKKKKSLFPDITKSTQRESLLQVTDIFSGCGHTDNWGKGHVEDENKPVQIMLMCIDVRYLYLSALSVLPCCDVTGRFLPQIIFCRV